MVRFSLRGGVVFLFGALALPGVVAAQGAPNIPTFSATSDLVVLSATALDGKGRPVRDLRPEELRIYEEGRLQRLAHFSEGPELTARVLLLVDASGSMNGELKTTSSRMAAQQVLAALSPQDEVAMAGFDSEYWGVVAFTRDRQKILSKFGELKPFGSTALHDALDKAARDLASHGEGRRAVVVITDGVDTSSRRSVDEVVARSRALDVPIYTISVLSPVDDPASSLFAGRERTAAATAGSAVLTRYAAMSGGAAFAVSDFKGLRQAAEQITAELKHQYRLGYDPPAGPKQFRRVEVKSTRKGVVIRTRSGYVPLS
jgi:Ca-activated chloride channel homolog